MVLAFLLDTGKGVDLVNVGVDSTLYSVVGRSVELEYRIEPPACELCTACIVVRGCSWLIWRTRMSAQR